MKLTHLAVTALMAPLTALTRDAKTLCVIIGGTLCGVLPSSTADNQPHAWIRLGGNPQAMAITP